MVRLGAIIGRGRSVLCCDTLGGATLAAAGVAPTFEAVDICTFDAVDRFNKFPWLALEVMSRLFGCLG